MLNTINNFSGTRALLNKATILSLFLDTWSVLYLFTILKINLLLLLSVLYDKKAILKKLLSLFFLFSWAQAVLTFTTSVIIVIDSWCTHATYQKQQWKQTHILNLSQKNWTQASTSGSDQSFSLFHFPTLCNKLNILVWNILLSHLFVSYYMKIATWSSSYFICFLPVKVW